MHRISLYMGLGSMMAMASSCAMDSARLSRQDLQAGVKTNVNDSLSPDQIQNKIILLEVVCQAGRKVLQTGMVEFLSGETQVLTEEERFARHEVLRKAEEQITELQRRLERYDQQEVSSEHGLVEDGSSNYAQKEIGSTGHKGQDEELSGSVAPVSCCKRLLCCWRRRR